MTKLVYATSTAADGNMSLKWGESKEVVKNRKKFLGKIGVSLEDCVTLSLMRSDGVKIVDGKNKGEMLEADALITTGKNVGLFMVTADCFPVIVYDPVGGVLALVHLGWQGVDKGLVAKVVRKMKGLGADELQVIIGPGIRKESYVFDVPLAQENDPKWQPFLEKLGNGRTAIDLVGFIKKQLVDCGVGEIEDCGIDTVKDLNYFSHYRAVRTGEPEGRFATVAMMK